MAKDLSKIIIDGVDVSECEHFGIDNMELCEINFDNNYFSNGIPCAEKCSNHSNCYYKQLQRAKAEIERLEDTCNELRKRHSEDTTRLSAEVQELKAENERLKEENKELKSSLVRQASTIFTLEKSSNDLSQGTNKLYKALQEIKDMATLFNSVNEDKGLDRFKNNIIAKINEVIGAEE